MEIPLATTRYYPEDDEATGRWAGVNPRAPPHGLQSETESIVVVAEQRQVDRVSHGLIAEVVRMHVIAAVVCR